MDKKKIAGIVVGILLLLVMIGVVTCGRREADPAGYVKANLDLIFQGDTQQAKEYIDATSEDLEKVYDAGIQTFVDTYLIGDLEVDTAYTATYDYLLKQIFAVMRYEVGEATQIDRNTYEVEVTYQPVNVFTKFIPMIVEESGKIQKALNSGAYGKKEEAQASALQDYLNKAYEALEMAYLELEYGEKETMTLTVTVEKDGTMEVQNNGINQFIEQILDLDNL